MDTPETLLPRICGTEIEYGFMGVSRHADETPLHRLFLSLPEGLSILNQYLSNGARMYIDVGVHPEYATPECRSFRQAVVAEIAGERIMKQALDSMVDKSIKPGYRLHKRVKDSRAHLNGAHESYLTSREINPDYKRIRGALATQFITRSFYTGAGSYDGEDWRVTQKLGLLQEVSYSISHMEGHRPIVDTRDEPLTNDKQWRRLHVTSGDANISPWAMWMKLGTTSLVLRLLENNVVLKDLHLKEPLRAAETIANDTTLRKTVELVSGQKVTAVEIQRELAIRFNKLSQQIPLPQEEQDITNELFHTCDDAVKNVDSLEDRVDWVKKKNNSEQIAETKSREHYRRNLQALDLTYDLVGEKTGQGIKLRNRGSFRRTTSEAEVELSIKRPPVDTRAHIRGRVILAAHQPLGQKLLGNPELIAWHVTRFQYARGHTFDNPYDSSHPFFDKLLERAGL